MTTTIAAQPRGWKTPRLRRATHRGRRLASAAAVALLAAATLSSGVRAEPPAYAWSLIARSPVPATLHPGEKIAVTVVLRNDGAATWKADRPGVANPFRLAAVAPRERSSAFGSDDPTWLWSGGRRIAMQTPLVASGEHGTFVFSFTAPALPAYPATFDERFAPVVEGVEVLDSQTISIPTTVRPVSAAVPAAPNPGLPAPPPAPADPPCDALDPSSCSPPPPPDLTPCLPSAIDEDRSPLGVSAGYRFGTPLPAALSAPRGVATDSVGRLVATDSGRDRVARLDANGVTIYSWGGTGSGPGQFRSPGGVAVTPSGQVLVADTGNDRVQVFTLSGFFLTQFGGTGTDAGRMSSPHGISVAPDGTILVADTGNRRVQVFTASGALVGAIVDDAMVEPVSASAFDGVVYVADRGANVIRRYTLGGESLGTFGGSGSGEGCLSGPSGVLATVHGVFVADTGRHAIRHYTRGGIPIESWGSAGTDAGRMLAPAALAMTGSASLVVAEQGGDRLQRFNARVSAAPPLPGA